MLLGAAILTFGLHNIHSRTSITEGGVLGLLLFANHWTGLPASVVSPVLDLLCYLLALRYLGAGFIRTSLVSTAAVAVCFKVWEGLPFLLPRPFGLAAACGAARRRFCRRRRRAHCAAGRFQRRRRRARAGHLSKLTGWRMARSYLVTDLTVLVLFAELPARAAHRLVACNRDGVRLFDRPHPGHRPHAPRRGGMIPRIS